MLVHIRRIAFWTLDIIRGGQNIDTTKNFVIVPMLIPIRD